MWSQYGLFLIFSRMGTPKKEITHLEGRKISASLEKNTPPGTGKPRATITKAHSRLNFVKNKLGSKEKENYLEGKW